MKYVNDFTYIYIYICNNLIDNSIIQHKLQQIKYRNTNKKKYVGIHIYTYICILDKCCVKKKFGKVRMAHTYLKINYESYLKRTSHQ